MTLPQLAKSLLKANEGDKGRTGSRIARALTACGLVKDKAPKDVQRRILWVYRTADVVGSIPAIRSAVSSGEMATKRGYGSKGDRVLRGILKIKD